MNNIYFIVFIIPIVFIFHYLRFKLTRWEEFVKHFESVKRPDLNFIYGFWSEFKSSSKSYPLSNCLLKVAVTSYGLFLQYDLKYEPIKFYKPVLIPWGNITVFNSVESAGKGSTEYIVKKNENILGHIFISVPVSNQIIKEVNKIGIEINIGAE